MSTKPSVKGHMGPTRKVIDRAPTPPSGSVKDWLVCGHQLVADQDVVRAHRRCHKCRQMAERDFDVEWHLSLLEVRALIEAHR